MGESAYDRINDYGAVKIGLASPYDIRSWSFGEVKKPETINYRTYRPEKDGLFCERIFGPEKDWECACGKYRGMKYKGMICDRCGVKVTHSRVRRKRMGHIELAAPVVHIWFFKAMPSRLGTLLDMKTSSMERIIYFQDYVVVDPGDAPLKERQLLTEEDFRKAREQFGDTFQADMGADAVRKLLARLDLVSLSKQLRQELTETSSKQKLKDLTKRLKVVEALRDSDNRPEWMVLEAIPVIPPDLRPLVLLDSGNFATSDLNDLYRRIINRNNRLKKLVDLNAPEVIIRNEKRMLQQAVDALFDNNRCKRPVLGSSNRPLKSLTDMIKGKQGRFRENLLGKRVDYSARSVIVVGPDLRLHQCGLPKKIALELFQPFIIRRLRELGHADTIKSAKKMLERKVEEVWDILEEVIHNHPVLLNRAPTLHRMGIQAFEPVLVEGNAIRIHPLVCKGFNADFDGDQMAVHLPLSIEAQVEAMTLMMSTNNIFSPANGNPIISPTQDIVMGSYYVTVHRPGEPGEYKKGENGVETGVYSSPNEVFLAFSQKKVGVHARIKLRLPEQKKLKGEGDKEFTPGMLATTTVGRVIFNDILHAKMPFYNMALGQKQLQGIIADCYQILGRAETIALLDNMKDLGFRESTRSGLSFATDDLKTPANKDAILAETEKEVAKAAKLYQRGIITEQERYGKVLDFWTHAREKITSEMMEQLRNDVRNGEVYLNPIFLMADSGARGGVEQIRQLAGMRGLMAKPSGKIIETPIKANFREGLSVLEYFSSTHGARKGLADTALKTADSGYLTRKLADVAQNVVITTEDCGTSQGITKGVVYKGEKIEVTLTQSIRGRISRAKIINPITDEVVVEENEMITVASARKLEDMNIEKIQVRSPMTCEASLGICRKCYGMDLATGQLENLRVEAEGRKKAEWIRPKPSSASTQLLGITKAAVQSESFISAASFQETTKVLTEAALAGKVDYLVGLKENVILGHLVPAGTGFKIHQEAEVRIRPKALEALAERGYARYPAELTPIGALIKSFPTGIYPTDHSLKQNVIKASQRPGLIVETANSVKRPATVETLKQHRSVILETIGKLRFCLIRHNHPNFAKSGQQPAVEQCTEIRDRIVKFRTGIKNFGEVDLDPSSEIARLLASAQAVLSDMVQVRGKVAELPRLLFDFVDRLHAIEEGLIRCVVGPTLSPSPEKAPTDTESHRELSVIKTAVETIHAIPESRAATSMAETRDEMKIETAQLDPDTAPLEGFLLASSAAQLWNLVHKLNLGRIVIQEAAPVDGSTKFSRQLQVCFYDHSDAAASGHNPLPTAPRLVLEIRPANTGWGALRRHVTQLLDSGVLAVCILLPEQKQVYVYFDDQPNLILNEDQDLHLPQIHPEFRLPIRSLVTVENG